MSNDPLSNALERIDQLVAENCRLRLTVAEREGRIHDLNGKLAAAQGGIR